MNKATTMRIGMTVHASLLGYSVVSSARGRSTTVANHLRYASNQVELAWTVIRFSSSCFVMATARVIAGVQRTTRPENAIESHRIGHQFWWEYRYPALES